jgi:molybdopterin/thiamine biosynthesis adenylyltransferase
MKMTIPRSLCDASALILGAGGLGSPAAIVLAASGVGRIGIVDDDAVDLSNLARQILHRTVDVGRAKVASTKERLEALAPSVKVETYPVRLSDENAEELIGGYDVVLDGSDNLAAKLSLNDACVLAGRPLVTGGILRFFGQLMTVIPGKTPCYRCVFGALEGGHEGPSCAEAGVFGAIAGIIGMAQAGEAVRILAGFSPAWAGQLATADFWNRKFGVTKIKNNPTCPACGKLFYDKRGEGAQVLGAAPVLKD